MAVPEQSVADPGPNPGDYYGITMVVLPLFCAGLGWFAIYAIGGALGWIASDDLMLIGVIGGAVGGFLLAVNSRDAAVREWTAKRDAWTRYQRRAENSASEHTSSESGA
jgi:hypothetical protein